MQVVEELNVQIMEELNRDIENLALNIRGFIKRPDRGF